MEYNKNLEFKKLNKIRKARNLMIFGIIIVAIGLLHSSIIFFIDNNLILRYTFIILFILDIIVGIHYIIYYNKLLKNTKNKNLFT